MKTTTRPITDLSQDPANARTHDERNLATITASLRRFGQQKPIVVDTSGVVRAGNGTLAAAKALGWDTVEVVETDLQGSEATAYAIADNRTAELAGWDDEVLAATLGAIAADDPDLLAAAGYDEKELEQLMAETFGEVVEDEAPEPPADPITKPGDLWALGEHRVLCGDSSSRDDVGRLMSGDLAKLLLTDPPYNLASHSTNYVANSTTLNGLSKVSKAYSDLAAADWDKNFEIREPLAVVTEHCHEDLSAYVWTSKFLISDVWSHFDDLKFNYVGYCIWAKPNPMPCLSKRHWTWGTELCAYATRGKHTFNFPVDGHALNWFPIRKNSDGTHPTQKTIEVIAHLVKHSSLAEDLVLDPFLGSGTTLIAAEQLNRKCYGLEISPAYCDVIIQRWENLTEQKAKLL